MITPEEREKLDGLLSRVTPADFFVFDTSRVLDDYEASSLIYLHRYAIKIYEVIVDLYVFDLTGCIDSEL